MSCALMVASRQSATRTFTSSHWALVFLMLFSVLCPRSTFASVDMTIDDARFDNGGRVVFHKLDSQPATFDAARLRNMLTGETQGHRYTVFLDLDSITPTTYGFTNYDFYLRPNLPENNAS